MMRIKKKFAWSLKAEGSSLTQSARYEEVSKLAAAQEPW
jgi:hypothetical protein